MARTAITVQQVANTGIVATYEAANAAGNSFTNNEKSWMEVINGSGSSINVTITTAGTANGIAVADPVIAVAAGATKKIGPFPSYPFEAADRSINVDYSAVTTVTVSVFTL